MAAVQIMHNSGYDLRSLPWNKKASRSKATWQRRKAPVS